MPLDRRVIATVAWGALWGLAVLRAQSGPPPASRPSSLLGTDVASLTSALADYIDRFSDEHTAVLAEERYVQLRHGWRGNITGPDSEAALAWREAGEGRNPAHVTDRRQLLSDVVFLHLSGADWMDFRDVAEVNGRPVRNRSQRVLDLFLSGAPDAMARARRFAEESARHNLPGLYRTLNLPNVALYFMRRSEQSRYQFERKRDEQVGGRQARVLAYRERRRPTIVQTSEGKDIPIDGRLWLDAETGQVVRTELRMNRWSGKSSIRVDYQALSGLDVLVPSQLWEVHDDRPRDGEQFQNTPQYFMQGLATYSGHKRFVVRTSETLK